MASTYQVFEAWAETPLGQQTIDLPPEAFSVLMQLAKSSYWGLSYASTQVEMFDPLCRYAFTDIEVGYAENGDMSYKWSITRVNFDPRWTNPLWEALKYEVELQTSLISKLVQNILREMPKTVRNNTNIPMSSAPMPIIIQAIFQKVYYYTYNYFMGEAPLYARRLQIA